MRKFEVVGVRVEIPSNTPIVLLKTEGDPRLLPIWIGAAEATAIAFAQQGVEPPRPLTHDLMKDLLEGAAVTVDAVTITGLEEGVFYASITLSNGAMVSARPSDAIALALRVGAPIFGSDEVFESAAIEIPTEEDAAELEPESEVERFREFLDTINPEDFGDPRSQG